ncbi:MAG TPA: HisA/HisF-related TIM barrel protein [Ilumatobacteraceae bacterium]|nr:HisA/HisF-related TIM barrel protein [Ilumatobacteraceae bacterium]
MSAAAVELYPAIDLLGGRVVRLTKGDFDAGTVYSDDPPAVAASFAAAGARWIHVVDLDAARSGDPVNRACVAAITEAVAGTTRVQSSGGVRTVGDVEALARLGVARVVMGSAAIAEPALVERAATVLPVAVGLDHRDGEVAVHGWTADSGVQLDEALGWFPAAAAFVVTDIGRDGTLAGPDVAGLTAVAASTTTPVIASGGVATLDDIAALAVVPGVGGIITGRAVYEGRFTVPEALAVLERVRR